MILFVRLELPARAANGCHAGVSGGIMDIAEDLQSTILVVVVVVVGPPFSTAWLAQQRQELRDDSKVSSLTVLIRVQRGVSGLLPRAQIRVHFRRENPINMSQEIMLGTHPRQTKTGA